MWTSSSSSSSSSRSTRSYNINMSGKKTMEEVWKDITLNNASHHLHPSTTTPSGVILQDFFSNDPPQPHAAAASPPAASPPTVLSLLLQQPCHHHHSQQLQVVEASARNKRLAEFQTSCGDRRHKRMIKNRESAARSRARKQAYTNELELEVAQLMEENARLKEQQEQLYRAAAAQQQKRKPLHRTLTAPF